MDEARDGNLPLVSYKPPFEEQLLQRTLWAEIQKLYGHGNELYSVCCNYKGTLLASSCKANKQSTSQAIIRIWDTKNWQEIQKIKVSELTVTQLEFSPNDKYLLSVSRDRMIGVIEIIEENDTFKFKTLKIQEEKHTRVIWSCSWLYNNLYFATGSRDKTVRFWKLDNDSISEAGILKFKSGVTSVSFAPQCGKSSVSFSPNEETSSVPNQYMIAIGLENGSISIWSGEDNINELKFQNFCHISPQESHSSIVRKMKWRIAQSNLLQLATCSDDHSIRIYNIHV